MKSIIFIITFLISIPAFSCQQEAQFIGKITDYTKTRIDQNLFDCTYKINFTMFNESVVCPLDIDEVTLVEFKDENCSLKNDDQISGVLVRLPTNQIVIE